MNFQATYLGPNKSAIIYSHFEPSGGCPCTKQSRKAPYVMEGLSYGSVQGFKASEDEEF